MNINVQFKDIFDLVEHNRVAIANDKAMLKYLADMVKESSDNEKLNKSILEKAYKQKAVIKALEKENEDILHVIKQIKQVRVREVMLELYKGKSGKEIASTMKIHIDTVANFKNKGNEVLFEMWKGERKNDK